MESNDLGLSIARMVAGFAGGLVSVFIPPPKTAMTMLGSVVGGIFTANYLGPAGTHYAPTWLGEGGVGFILGLTAMIVCQFAVLLVTRRLKIMNGVSK